MVVPGAGDGCVDETEFYQNFGTGKDTPKFVDMVNAVDNGQTNCITKVCASERLRVCVCVCVCVCARARCMYTYTHY